MQEITGMNNYRFLRGINKTCEDFVKLINENEEFYNGSKALRIIRHVNKFNQAQKLEYLKDISKIYFEINDVRNIDLIQSAIDDYIDLYCDPDSYEFKKEQYNNNVESDNPGFKSFYECFSKFYDKIEIDYLRESNLKILTYLDSDSDSDDEIVSDSDESGFDSDDIASIFGNYKDSETDSDSDSDNDRGREYINEINEFFSMLDFD